MPKKSKLPKDFCPYDKPYRPSRPRPPKKTVSKKVTLAEIDVTYAELKPGDFPEGTEVISFRRGKEMEFHWDAQCCDDEIIAICSRIEDVPNPEYQKEYGYYKLRLEEYKEELANYKLKKEKWDQNYKIYQEQEKDKMQRWRRRQYERLKEEFDG